MTKNLFLIRHAHAESNNEIRDFDRKLTPQGLLDATEMSRRMLQHTHHSVTPEFILSSPATRAMNTAKLFAENLSIPFNKIQPENTIYEASMNTLLSLINHLNNKYATVALFGHNPGISDLLNYLSSDFFGTIPTAGIVQLKFEIKNWNMITEDSGRIEWYAFPNS
jgi:phosphohistidine phosphatase